MKLASFQWGGKRHVGTVTADGRELTPLAFDAARGALALVEHLSAGGAMPPAAGPRLALVGGAARCAAAAPAPQPVLRRPQLPRACEGARGLRVQGQGGQRRRLADRLHEAAGMRRRPGANVEVPRSAAGLVSEQIDYEAELAVVIGNGGKNIGRARAIDHVFGYTIVNDVTARDVQVRHSQWDLGKCFDTFCPMGPFIVTADECDGSEDARALLGQRRAAPGRRTADLIFDIPTLIETCLARHHACSGRRDRHRHAGRRRHGHDAAALPEGRRRDAHRDRRPRRDREQGRLSAMTTQFIDRLAVEIDGEGDAVLCIHGLGGSSNNWTPVMAALERFKVIRLDLPGSARSLASKGALSIERYVDSVLSVCGRLGIERCTWSRTRSAPSSRSTSPCASRPGCAAWRCSARWSARRKRRGRTSRRGPRRRAAKGSKACRRSPTRSSRARPRPKRRQQRPVAVALVRESLMRQYPEGYAQSCEALADAQSAAIEPIDVPTLLVTGDEDGVAPPQSVRGDGRSASAAAGWSSSPAAATGRPSKSPTMHARTARQFHARSR